MLINRNSISATGNAADSRIKAEKQEVISSVAKAGKKYAKMLTQLSK